MTFAIKNIKTGKFVFGTDYRYFPPRQRTSTDKMLLYDSREDAEIDFIHRRCNKNYCVVGVIVTEKGGDSDEI